MSFLKAFEEWLNSGHHDVPEVVELPDDDMEAAQALRGVRAQLDVVTRETKALEVQLTMAEIALKARGWMPTGDSQ